MLTVHHLGISQSERIVWLCEELDIPYTLTTHTRDPILAPDSLKSLPGNETGKAPFIEDSDAGVTLSESGAICDYIIGRYGKGKLQAKPSDKNFADYVFWFHYANASLHPAMTCCMFVQYGEVPATNMMKGLADQRLHTALGLLDARLSTNKWLAGNEESSFSAADVMTVYCLTTQRYWGPQVDLAQYKGILRYLRDCCTRPAYRRAMEKGDPEMKVLSGPEAPEKGMIDLGGTKSEHWKKG